QDAVINTKANQTDLNATNAQVATNTTNIGTLQGQMATKADQSALDATNANVATNTQNIAANTAAIATKADTSYVDGQNQAQDAVINTKA
ncbi:hypothetical protein, partial [Faucicola atlantae]|uniref:hypothetical protein n=1 Tax=Faucicola atlantae TaxID=34059 RepID=UPI001C12B544